MFSVLKIWLVLDGNIGQVVEKKANLKSQKLYIFRWSHHIDVWNQNQLRAIYKHVVNWVNHHTKIMHKRTLCTIMN